MNPPHLHSVDDNDQQNNKGSGGSSSTSPSSTSSIRCHYEVLGIPLDADDVTIKKAHRKLVLLYHPDKNTSATANATTAANKSDDDPLEKFRLVQEAYECLSDPVERKWYDDHREAILKGWSAGSNNNSNSSSGDLDILFDIVHLMHPSCYRGYEYDDKNSSNNIDTFWGVYGQAFATINEKELNNTFPIFGDSKSSWNDVVSPFYQAWESFNSNVLSFAWADEYDTSASGGDIDAIDNSHMNINRRQVKRAMHDANLKARKAARKARNNDVRALVAFVKKRDPRVRARMAELEQQKAQRQWQQQQQVARRKELALQARQQWKEQQQQVEEELAAAEEKDRLAGRIRLADLDDEDYDYDVGKKSKKKGKKKNKKRQQQQQEEAESLSEGDNEKVEKEKEEIGGGEQATSIATDKDDSDQVQKPCAGDDPGTCLVSDGETSSVLFRNDKNKDKYSKDKETDDDDEDDDEEEEEEPDIWRCECCRKDFKSKGQMENHFQSKKHKQAYKAFQAKKAQQMDQEFFTTR